MNWYPGWHPTNWYQEVQGGIRSAGISLFCRPNQTEQGRALLSDTTNIVFQDRCLRPLGHPSEGVAGEDVPHCHMRRSCRTTPVYGHAPYVVNGRSSGWTARSTISTSIGPRAAAGRVTRSPAKRFSFELQGRALGIRGTAARPNTKPSPMRQHRQGPSVPSPAAPAPVAGVAIIPIECPLDPMPARTRSGSSTTRQG